MKCKLEHRGDCFNSGSPWYLCKCEQPCNNIIPKTNADHIRAMSDEELCLWARKQIGCGFDFFPCGVVCDGKCDSFDEETCKTKIMEYLKQPVEDK